MGSTVPVYNLNEANEADRQEATIAYWPRKLGPDCRQREAEVAMGHGRFSHAKNLQAQSRIAAANLKDLTKPAKPWAEPGWHVILSPVSHKT